MALNIGNLFARQPNIATQEVSAPAAPSGAQATGQSPSLPVGSVVSGQVVEAKGDTVMIRTDDGQNIQARMESQGTLTKGSYVSFEVSGVSDSQVTLKALFTNTAAGSSTMSAALSQAGITETANSFGMVRSMMENGMSIDKSALQSMYRLATAHPETAGENIVNMTKLGLPLTEENIQQFEAYRNLEHQINRTVGDISDSMASAIDDLIAGGDGEKALGFLKDVTNLLTGQSGQVDGQIAEGAKLPAGENAFLQLIDGELAGEAKPESVPGQQADATTASQGAQGEQNAQNAQNAETAQPKNAMDELMKALSAASDSMKAQEAEGASGKVIIREAGIESGQTPKAEGAALQDDGGALLAKLSEKVPEGSAMKEIADGIRQLLEDKDNPQAAARLEKAVSLLKGSDLKNMLSQELSKAWRLDPQSVADKGKVQEFYERLRDQSTKLQQIVESSMGKESKLFEQVTNVRSNVDFMNQLNQTAAYVQLPLRLNGDDAHGDLYVYTNKKSMAQQDGKVSAFLHLDMDHLGPVDVYVAMEHEKVSTNFYLRDDAMIDFISENIGILNDRLADRGYDMTCKVTQKPPKEPEKNVMDEILEDHRDGFLIGSKSFDVLA